MTPRQRRLLLILAITLLVGLILVPAALAAAGGGSAGFSGGGDGGGGGGGGGGRGFEIYLIFRVVLIVARMGHGLGLLVLVVLGLVYWFYRKGAPNMTAFFSARRQRGHTSARATRKRERRVELAAAEAADEDPLFDPDHVRVAAGTLFTQIQFAWDAADRIALRGLIAPRLLEEWERRLDDFDRKGWRNHTQPLEPPKVEFVGLVRGDDPDDQRVVVRIEARLRDYVVDRDGRRIKRRGQFTETVRLREFWTLQRRGNHWILASIEQGAEGAHALKDRVVPTAASDDSRLKDEAMIEGAVADAVPAGTDIAQLADLQFTGSARAAANDLSLADGRFAPDVLEIAARRAVTAWAEAVDGSDEKLRKLASAGAIHELLHPGDPSERTRVVVRGPEVRQIRIANLDAASDPPTMTIDVDLQGKRYIEDRDTTQVLSGDAVRVTKFTERWTMSLNDDPQQPWRIAMVGSPAATT